MADETMGTRLKQLRKEFKYTQKDIADFLDVSQSLIAKIESDERNLKLTQLLEISALYNTTEEYIIYGEKPPDNNIPHFKKDNKGISLRTIMRMNKIVRNLYEMNEIKRKSGNID